MLFIFYLLPIMLEWGGNDIASWVSKIQRKQFVLSAYCVQMCNNVAQGSSLRPETLWVPLRTWRNQVTDFHQLNYWPRSLKVTSQLMRYSQEPFKRVLTLTSFYFSTIAEIYPPFLPCLSALTSSWLFLISKPFHPYLPPRSSQLLQPSENGKRMG